MLRYHVAFYLPKAPGEMVVGGGSRFSRCDDVEDLAQALLEEGKPLPAAVEDARSPEADLIEQVALSVHAGNVPK